MAETRIGIGGWSYAPWRGTFFPKGLAQSKELEFASRQFGAIEINGTFYSRQARSTWEKWGAAVPEGFQFAIKGSRYCVTRPKMADAGEGIANFLAQGVDALGPKLGPILWMLAARRKFDREDIAAFFKLLPSSHGGVSLRHVIEPRHESFRDEAFFNLCREHDVAVVFGDDDEFPCIDADTASFAYARLQRMDGGAEHHGGGRERRSGDDEKGLFHWSLPVSGWSATDQIIPNFAARQQRVCAMILRNCRTSRA